MGWDLPPPPPDPPALHHDARACVVRPDRGARGPEPRPSSIGSVVSDTYPLRVHWTEDGYADRAATVLAFAEQAWEVQVDTLGFAPPDLPDDQHGPELDIYLDALGEWEGYSVQVDWVDTTLGDGRMSSPAWIAFDQDLPEAWLGPYTVHEFNHVLQIATDFTETANTIWEATATAAQAWTLGDAGFWDADVADFQSAPHKSVLTGVGDEDPALGTFFYEYGAALWMKHLDEVAGLGPFAGPILWDTAAQEGEEPEPDVVDAFVELDGGSLAMALSSVGATRLLTGRRAAIGGLEDASGWTDDFAVVATPYAPSSTLDLDILGQAFVSVPADARTGRLVVEPTDGIAARALLFDPDGRATDAIQLDLGARGNVLPVEPGALWVVVTRLPPPGWDGDDATEDGAIIDLTLRFESDPDDVPDDACADCASPGAALLPLAVLPITRRRRTRSSARRAW